MQKEAVKNTKNQVLAFLQMLKHSLKQRSLAWELKCLYCIIFATNTACKRPSVSFKISSGFTLTKVETQSRTAVSGLAAVSPAVTPSCEIEMTRVNSTYQRSAEPAFFSGHWNLNPRTQSSTQTPQDHMESPPNLRLTSNRESVVVSPFDLNTILSALH